MRVLLADDEEDLRDLICFTLESQCRAEVVQARTGNEAIRLVDSSPPFDLIVSDYAMPEGTGEDLYRHLLSKGSQAPFVLVSAYSMSHYPVFTEHPPAAFIQKPDVFKALKQVLEKLGFTRSGEPTPAYFAIRTSVILSYGLLAQDLYIRLSDDKYVKIFRKGDLFDASDFERFKAKTVEFLHVRAQDADALLEGLTRNITRVLSLEPVPDDALRIAGSSVEIIAEVAHRLGLTPKAQNLTRTSVNLALKAITTRIGTKVTLPVELPPEQSYLSAHSMAVAHAACGIASLLGWASGPTFLKLSLAAFLHDVTLSNPEMTRLQGVDDLAIQRHKFTEAEVNEYLAHPIAASKLAKELKDLPADVDTIILQHHERPDGSGLLQLDHTKLDPLSAVFIVAHDIVNFYQAHGTKADLAIFLNTLGDAYSKGNFKAVIKQITSSLVNAAA